MQKSRHAFPLSVLSTLLLQVATSAGARRRTVKERVGGKGSRGSLALWDPIPQPKRRTNAIRPGIRLRRGTLAALMPRHCDRAPLASGIDAHRDSNAGSQCQKQPYQDGGEPACHCGQYRTPISPGVELA
jgi:hypothetical protein